MYKTKFFQRISLVLAIVCVLAYQANSQNSQPESFVNISVKINGNIPNQRIITEAELLKLPMQTVKVRESDGSESVYEGPELSEVLKLAGIIFGEELKGERLATYLLAKGADKFKAVFALPELDSSYTDRLIILAIKRNSQPLSTAEGPLRIIIPSEKRRSRWVKQLKILTIKKAG